MLLICLKRQVLVSPRLTELRATRTIWLLVLLLAACATVVSSGSKAFELKAWSRFGRRLKDSKAFSGRGSKTLWVIRCARASKNFEIFFWRIRAVLAQGWKAHQGARYSVAALSVNKAATPKKLQRELHIQKRTVSTCGSPAHSHLPNTALVPILYFYLNDWPAG